jgi:arylsulfatase A-like enzyme
MRYSRGPLGWIVGLAVAAAVCRAADPAPMRPNLLWITCEDMGPDLGCYGSGYAVTPNIDRLAREGVLYTRAFATAPACSPARSCLISGRYATTLGTPHLRSDFPVPSAVTGFPSHLRAAGYYCSNQSKTDYNTSDEPAIVAASWDACGNRAHWRGRRPGQPFFAVFNYMGTHQAPTTIESDEAAEKRLGALPAEVRHDPARAPVPPYYPDTLQVRRTLARYADNITLLDRDHVGRILRELEEDGLAEDTIVFFFSDHGAGMPRHKRLALDTGLRVPLLIRVPAKLRAFAPAAPGRPVDGLVSFADFAPTVLRLAGLSVPEGMQGCVFLGPDAGPAPEFLAGARDRVDEAIDTVRSVREARFLYARNFLPHISHAAPEGYSDQSPMRREIVRLAREGKLNAAQMTYASPTRAVEELYDTETDPFLIHNLAGSAEHREILVRMRQRLAGWVVQTRDLGFIPESDLRARIAGTTPFDLAAAGRIPVGRIFETADLVGRTGVVARQIALLKDDDAAVRYWAAVGLRAAGVGTGAAREALTTAMGDPAPSVRIEAAGALVAAGETGRALDLLGEALTGGSSDVAVHAARTLQLLGERARPALPRMEAVLAGPAPTGAGGKAHAMFLGFALAPAVEALQTTANGEAVRP